MRILILVAVVLFSAGAAHAQEELITNKVHLQTVDITTGSADPESTFTAPPGSLYLRTNGDIYKKSTGTGSTGWVKLARVNTIADLPSTVAYTDIGNVFGQKQTITVNGEVLTLSPVTGTNATYQRMSNTGDVLLFGLESSAGGTIFTGTSAYAAVFGTQGAHPLIFATNNTNRLTIDTSGHLTPYLDDAADLGSAFKTWRKGYISEIQATLFAKETQTLYGGWLSVSKNAGVLGASVTDVATTVNFGMAMTLNQFVLIRAADNNTGVITHEYMKVGTLVSGTTYNVTRNLSGIGAKHWATGTPFMVRGVSGDGWVELNAYDTPRMSVWTQGTLYNNSVENIRIGHLTGMPNSSSGIGAYMGDATNYLRWDGTAFKLVSASATIDSNGIVIQPGTALSTLNAYKFSRLGSGSFGQTGDSFGMAAWYLAGGPPNRHELEINNILVGLTSGAGGQFGRASTSVQAAGWDSSAGTSGPLLGLYLTSNPGALSSISLGGAAISLTSATSVTATGANAFSLATNAFGVNGTSGSLTLSVTNAGVPLTINQSLATNGNGLYVDITRTDSTSPVGEVRFNASDGQKWGVGTNIRVGGTALEFNSGTANLGYFTTSSFVLTSGTTLTMPGIAAVSGTRYLCISTTGAVSSSATACSGT